MEKKGKLYQINNELINRCKKGDQLAQVELYKNYYKMAYSTCLRIVKNPVEAEDLMQEGFIAAFSNMRYFKGDVSFGSWLKKIVVNKSIDFLKKQSIRFSILDEDVPDEQTDSNIGEIDNQTEIEKVKKAINELADGYRIILSLYLFEGFDHEEIAQILKITPSTSRSQYSRAKQKLLKALKETK